MNFKEWLAVNEGLLAPNKVPDQSLSRINSTPRTAEERRKLVANKVKIKPVGAPPEPTVRQVVQNPFSPVAKFQKIRSDSANSFPAVPTEATVPLVPSITSSNPNRRSWQAPGAV